tara:strand:- start:40870 stop:41934 length:1065 start_codon:yes stop_codon:yes gene_type:complete
MRSQLPLVFLLPTLAATLVAQNNVVGPQAIHRYADSNNSSGLPWNNGATSALRVQYVYDSSMFTLQNVAFPIVITRLRWRADAALTSTGGTMDVTIDMATATTDHTLMSTTFAANLGPDLTPVFNGPVNVAAAAGTSPNTWYADVTLSTPFVYDPTSGNDLAIDIGVPANGWTGGTTCRQDLATAPTLGSRIYDLTSNTATVGIFTLEQSAVIEITYIAPGGLATTQPYGIGCNAGSELILDAATRPLLNSNADMVVSGIPAGVGLGVMALSLTQINPGASLAAAGMPGCSLYLTLDFTDVLIVTGATANYTLAVPNNPALVGQQVFAESAMLSPGANAAGLVTSNGLALTIGN